MMHMTILLQFFSFSLSYRLEACSTFLVEQASSLHHEKKCKSIVIKSSL
jgi:hypothetical protein